MSEEDKMEELEETAAADEESDDEEDEFAGGEALFNMVVEAGCVQGRWEELTAEAKQKWQMAADNL